MLFRKILLEFFDAISRLLSIPMKDMKDMKDTCMFFFMKNLHAWKKPVFILQILQILHALRRAEGETGPSESSCPV